MTERRGRENKLKTERLRQRAKTAKVPESASPICLGAPPPPGSGILGTLRLRLKLRARGRAGKNRGRERPRGPRGGRRLGDRMPGSCRRFLTPPRTGRWALAPGPLPSSNWSLGTPTAVPTVRASPVRSQPPIPAGASATPHRHAPSLFRLGAAPLPQPRAPRFPSPPGELRAPGSGVRRVWTVTRGP